MSTNVGSVLGNIISTPTSSVAAKSVFDYEYIPTSKAVDYTAVTSGYFTIEESSTVTNVTTNTITTNPDPMNSTETAESVAPVTKTQQTATTSTKTEKSTFWHIIVTVLAEVHEEKFSMHNTLADSVSIFSTGAKPVAISISGYVLFSKKDDHLYELLKNYVEGFRARLLSAQNKHLKFFSQDTEFSLILQSISLGYTNEMETYVPITFSGLAYEYHMRDSTEALLRTYYGTEGKAQEEKITKDKEVKKKVANTATTVSKVAEEVTKTAEPPFRNP